MIRAVDCLSGMSAMPCALESPLPSCTAPTARSTAFSLVPIGAPTTVNPPPSAVRTTVLDGSKVS